MIKRIFNTIFIPFSVPLLDSNNEVKFSISFIFFLEELAKSVLLPFLLLLIMLLELVFLVYFLNQLLLGLPYAFYRSGIFLGLILFSFFWISLSVLLIY